MRRFLSLVVGVSLLLGFVSPVSAYYTNMSASVVVGQPDFTSSSTGTVSQSTLSTSLRGLFVDPHGRMIIADENNNRVLIWNSIPTTNGKNADLVLGQPDFNSSTANNGGRSASTLNLPTVAYSDGERLYITDANNSRILVWNAFPTRNQQAADIVIGQTDMTSSPVLTCDTVHTSQPNGIWVYQNKLFVSDANHSRVLIWNQVPTSNGTAADMELGQTNLSTCTNPSTPTQSNLNSPRHLMIDARGRLIVADRAQNRLLIWNSIPTVNNQPADVVVGQTDFVSKLTPSPPTASSANIPFAYSNGNRLFMGDLNNRRLLIYNSIPQSNGASADMVLGQTDFVSNTNNGVSASSFNPTMPFEYNNQLLVTESANSRVLIFQNIISTPELTLDGIEKLEDNRLKLSGNVKLGEAGHYDLGGGGGVSFSINGSDGVGVNSIGNEVSDGAGSKYWEFSNTFEPWTGGNGTKDEWFKNFDHMRSTLGFSIKVASRSSNTDSSKLFYFEPFKLTSFTPTSVKFSVVGQNPWYASKIKDSIQRVKDNIDHFEIWVKRKLTVPYSISSTSTWTKYIDKISTENISSKGEVNLTNLVPITKLTQGNYQVKVVAVSKESNLSQDSNTVNYTTRRVSTTPKPTVQAQKAEVIQTPQPSPEAAARQATPTPTPIPQSKSCFLWWCW